MMQLKTLAGKCATVFKARILAYADGGNEDLEEEKQILETQNARFNLWADNLGVFAEGTASLDARLQDHEDIAALVVAQMHSVLRHLGRMVTYQCSENDRMEIHAAEHIYDDAYSSSARSESEFSSLTSGDTTSQASGLSVEEIEAQETPPLAAIIQSVHRLHRVGMAIRRSGTASHDMKAAVEQFHNEDGEDVIDIFQNWCIELLHHKFKTADEETLKRIAHTNAERRRRFLYRKKHQKKLAGRRDSEQTMTKVSSMPTAQAHLSIYTPSMIHSNVGLGPVRQARGSNAQFSQTTASKIAIEAYHYEPSVQTTMRSAAPSTALRFDTSLFPPAPKVPTGAAEFYCPYCCKIHPVAERSGRHWKQHFLKDLSPFVCLVEQCNEPNEMYPDQQSWIRHMESHNIKYTCQQHSKPLQFDTEADFDQHILTEHRKFPPSHLARLRSFNSSSARLDISTCPICGFIPTNAPNPGQTVANHEMAYRELLAHIANDMHFIAMWSLDEGDDLGPDISSNAIDFGVVDESTQAADLMSASLDRYMEIYHIEDWRDEPNASPAEQDETHDAFPEDVDPEDEWFLVHEKKSPYPGHEVDPKLENFVRRFQLDKLLEEGRPADPQLPCYFLPFKPSRDFHGRNDALQLLEANLHPSRATRMLRTMTLTGPAGIGKTQLAIQYCHNFQNQYDVVLWVHADEESKLANDFVRISIELGFVGRDSAESRDLEHCRQLVKAWLANPLKTLSDPESSETASWLLVLDHIIDPDVVNEYWPTDCQSGSILITSRKAMPWSLTHYPVLPVEPFDSTDSARFLSRLIQNDEMKDGALRLGSRASHSPTQLIFLARMISSGRYSLENFVQASRDDDGKKVILLLHVEAATKDLTDFSDWALESLSHKAAALLDVMAMLDPDHIVQRMLMLPPDNISILAYPKNGDEYYEARSELLKFSFISRHRSTGILSIHRVIQDATRRNMSEQHFRDVFNSCVALINDHWPYQAFTWRHSISRWGKCEELYPHIVRLQYFSGRIPSREDDVNGEYGWARLETDVAWYCHERGRSSEGVIFLTSALKSCLKLRGYLDKNSSLSNILDVAQIDRTIGEIHHNHGVTIAEMNCPQEALEHQLVFNRMMLKELGDRPGTDMRLGLSFNELGVAYMINDDWTKGEECFKRSVEEMRRLDDYKKYKISLPLVNWAWCYFLNGQYVKAEEILLEGLADRVEQFGENDQESFITGRFYHGLANVKLGQGLEQDNFEYLERARDHYKTTLGRGHHRSADIAVALGRHYGRTRDDEKAYDCFTFALDAYGARSIYTPEKTRTFFQRAKSLRRLGRDAEAKEDEDDCIELYRGLVPHDERALQELTDGDLDRLIVFWSR